MQQDAALMRHVKRRTILVRVRARNVQRAVAVEGQIMRHHWRVGHLPKDIAIGTKGMTHKDVVESQPALVLVLLAKPLLADDDNLRECKCNTLAQLVGRT